LWYLKRMRISALLTMAGGCVLLIVLESLK
jgi:hypothetical protein